MYLPSGLKAALFTPPVCPFKILICLPLLASQMRTVLSLNKRLPGMVIMYLPSGLKAALFTRSVYPLSTIFSRNLRTA